MAKSVLTEAISFECSVLTVVLTSSRSVPTEEIISSISSTLFSYVDWRTLPFYKKQIGMLVAWSLWYFLLIENNLLCHLLILELFHYMLIEELCQSEKKFDVSGYVLLVFYLYSLVVLAVENNLLCQLLTLELFHHMMIEELFYSVKTI